MTGSPTFDHVSYDEQGDVLYLSIGTPREAADSDETPEGHIVRYDHRREIIGVTLVNAHWLLERDGGLFITLPGASTASRIVPATPAQDTDPLLRAFAAAPEDDEPWTEDDDEAVAESRAEFAAGRSLSHEAMLKKWG